MMRLPNFVIIGAPKCGTTSLYHYLQQHPEVYLPKRKELHYFSYEYMQRFAAGPGDKELLTPLCATRQAYEQYYQNVHTHLAIGDVSPSYLYYAQVNERIKAELEQPKIVVVLRNPVEKAYSQYMHLVRDNREPLEFYQALMAEKQRITDGWGALWRYAESSLYTEKLKKYLHTFGEDRVKILFFETLSRSPSLVLTDLFQFLGVNTQVTPDTSTVHHRSGKPKSKLLANFVAKPNVITGLAKKFVPESLRTAIRTALLNINTGDKGQIDEKSRAYLQEYFYHDVQELEKIVGKDLHWLS